MNKYLKKQSVPIYVFDEHNEAFYFWHKAKHEGYINESLDLFHVDAHNDMGRVEKFNKSIYFPDKSQDGYLKYYENIAKKELDLGNFIMPAILNGLIKNVYFLYPQWRNYKPRRQKFNICSAFGEGRVLKYDLKIDKNPDARVFKAFSDLRYCNYSMMEINKMPMKRKVILDIDLDYFACRDTILNQMSFDLEITKEQFLKKDDFILNNKMLKFSGLEFSFSKKKKKYYVKISHKKQKDASYLPTKKEIEAEINTLVNTLKNKKIKPAVVTICRSCISGYCPADYYKFIETYLKQKLQILLDPLN